MSETEITPTPDAAESAAPAAQVKFSDFGLSPAIQRALEEQGYVHPTPIQAKAIPVLLQGRDVMGAAQTGTGKTASFSLPIIQNLLQHANTSMSPAHHAVRALVRPTLTLGLSTFLASAFFALAPGDIDRAYVADSLVFAAVTSIVWWFGDRAPHKSSH